MPHKWSNVRSFYLKGPETAALPIYQTDELWLDDSKVIADGAEQPASEKANIGKKRKAAEDEETEEAIKDESRPTKKAKKTKAPAALPESNDDKLDKEIATRKATLRKQKAAAKKAVEV